MKRPVARCDPVLALDIPSQEWYNDVMELKEKKRVTILFPLDVWASLREIAKEHGRSLVGEILWALRQYIRQYQEGK